MRLPLAGRTIAISISDSPDLPGLGLGEEHLVEAMFEFARYLVQLGGTVAYGGDLRPGGFTVNLLDLSQALGERDTPPIRSYLAWPIHLELTQARKDDFKNLADFVELPEVTGTVDPGRPLPPTTVDAQLVWARNLTAMRRRMANDCDARIVLGGRLTEALGAMPGIVEEALCTMRAPRAAAGATGKPLYVLGGFGGAGRAIWDALNGQPVPALSVGAQEHGSPGYAAFLSGYNAWPPRHLAKRPSTTRVWRPSSLFVGPRVCKRASLPSSSLASPAPCTGPRWSASCSAVCALPCPRSLRERAGSPPERAGGLEGGGARPVAAQRRDLAERAPGLDAGMKLAVVALEAAAIPGVEHRLGEQAALHRRVRELGVGRCGAEQHRSADLA